MRANCLIPLSLYEDHDESARAQVLFRKEKQKRESCSSVSLVSRFVFCAALYSNRLRTTFIKENCVLGKNPRFCVSRCVRFLFSVAVYIGSLSFSVYVCISKERARVCSCESRFIGFRFSLCSCRSFPRKRLVSKDRERKERINWRQHHQEEERRP